jgi:uncharacterized protein (DUF983 family)
MPTPTPIATAPTPGWLAALLRGRCPRCRRGAVFSGSVTMHERCPDCGLKFEREQGYFVGSMYVSYGIAVVMITALFWVVSFFAPNSSFEMALTVASVLFLVFVPLVFRYSRIIWMYVDRTIDPTG